MQSFVHQNFVYYKLRVLAPEPPFITQVVLRGFCSEVANNNIAERLAALLCWASTLEVRERDCVKETECEKEGEIERESVCV